jgi:hypothetical protein
MNTCRISIVVFFACVMIGCSRTPERLPNGQTYIKGCGEVFIVYYVHEQDGTLLYAFVADPALQVVSTNDPDSPPSATGIHRLRYSRDGVWINGKRAVMPKDSRVFAIRKDGSVHTVSCSDEQLRAISPGGGISDAKFVAENLLPALGIQRK